MPKLKKCFERAGFKNVVTVLSSGNVVFDAPATLTKALELHLEKAMSLQLKKKFPTVVRAQSFLQKMIKKDPFKKWKLADDEKRVVTFLKNKTKRGVKLPAPRDGARILVAAGTEVFTGYRTSSKGPVFMVLIEKTFGKDVTTRTWETVKKVAVK